MDKSKIKCVAVIQCAVAHERCPGVKCAGAFAHRKHYFAGYGPQVEYYLPFGCGGCPGRRVGRLASLLKRVMKKDQQVEPDEIAVHLASCIVTDNGHYPPCPHRGEIKTILSRKGLQVVEGSVIAESNEARRQAGVYAPRPPIDNVT
ncbi:MAG TPA: CGGC domain-containing protein [Phycisphaerae bacterium]|nr:CGGC domain-containing protein [Phycisphaerae bacterium]HUT61739.1 CGGC domain-containing protein [Phycisphaerae bacterium]